MAINLNNKVSKSDMEKINDIKNPPEYESGFESESSDNDMFAGMFDNIDDLFGDESKQSGGNTSSGNNDIFGTSNNSNNGSDIFGNSNNNSDIFGNSNNSNGFGNSNNGFNMQQGNVQFDSMGNIINNQGEQSKKKEKDNLDKMIDSGEELAKDVFGILGEMVKSTKDRNVDDYGYLGRNLIIVAGCMFACGIVLGIIGTIMGIKVLSFNALSAQIMLASGISLSAGLISMGTAAFILDKMGEDGNLKAESIEDIPLDEDNVVDKYEDNIGDEMDDILGEDFDDLFDSLDSSDVEETDEDEEETFKPSYESIGETAVNYDGVLDNIGANQLITRETLFNTFKVLFQLNKPNFSELVEIDSNSNEFEQIEAICLKALANVARKEVEDIKSHLESARSCEMSYELRMTKINGINKTDELAREIEIYFRDSAKDTDKVATVDREGDFYKIVITTGEHPIITFGDIFKQKKCCDYFLDRKNRLPIITGITELGEVILDDAQYFQAMLIAGKPRSGKSWYILDILMSLMLFNLPEDVQFIIVDPKESTIFNTMSLLPHVAGLHTDEKILDIMDDIIDVEGPRRKKLLKENKCEDIWELRDKGIKLPILYLVIDEYITVRNNLGSHDSDLDTKLQTIMSQFPSQGIVVVIVPHRSTGIVNKTNRTLFQFTAAVRSDVPDIKETLGLKDWSRSLTNVGDIALKTSSLRDAIYVRGAALTTKNSSNVMLITTVAKALYKMGVDMPDMSNMKVACNRDEDRIRNELSDNNIRVQYDAAHILDEIDEKELE